MDEIFMNKDALMQHLDEGSKVFKNPLIRNAFEAVDRKDFVSDDFKIEAYEDYPLPTISGQTISQPTTVAFMLELLDPKPGQVILDVGAGTGWTTALLGHIVGKEGKVIGLEIRPELVELGQKNIQKYKNLPIEIVQAGNDTGYYKNAPFDRILAGAAFPSKSDIPFELLLQLAVGGIMVVPIGESIVKFEKTSDEQYFESEFPGFVFVPYVQKFGDENGQIEK